MIMLLHIVTYKLLLSLKYISKPTIVVSATFVGLFYLIVLVFSVPSVALALYEGSSTAVATHIFGSF
jgi:hypothetical protein